MFQRFSPEWILALIALGTQFYFFFRWLVKRMANDEINRKFVKDVATNHLPHIYHVMQKLADHHGVEIDEPPPVRWAEINGNGKTHGVE